MNLYEQDIIKVKGLKKQYKNFCLDNISFDIKRKEIVGFVGANGAGKTTIIKALTGLISSEYEELSFFGLQQSDGNEKSIKERIGVVLSEGYFFDSFTIGQMKSLIVPAYKNWDENVFQTLLAKYELTEKLKIKTLSKGMKMKVPLAIALSHHAELLILDEPSSGLDPVSRDQMIEDLKSLVESDGCSILISTHILEDLNGFADKLLLIEKGKMLFYGTIKELEDDYRRTFDNEKLNMPELILYYLKRGRE